MTAGHHPSPGLVAVGRTTIRTAAPAAVTAPIPSPGVARGAASTTADAPPFHGPPPAAVPPPVGPGTAVGGRYVALELLARGGTSDVFRARDTRTGGLVALKVLRDTDALAAHRLSTEVRLLARFEHRHLVRVHDVGDHAGCSFLVLELADGGTLASTLADGPLEPRRVATVGVALADALRYVHAQGVVHRDVTPANVLLDGDGRAMLGDFGIAKTGAATAVTDSGVITGTVAYIAPEVLDGVDATPATDVYALGLVLTECLTGRRAFTGTPSEVAAAKLGRARVVPDSVPPSWRPLLRAMTNRDPCHRPSAAAVHVAMRRRSTALTRVGGGSANGR